MKYRATIYLGKYRTTFRVTSVPFVHRGLAEDFLGWMLRSIEQATGGHIEQYVDGIGWVVCEEPEVSDE